jgi:predicted transcriptional regulator
MSYKKTLEEIQRLMEEIQDQLEANYATVGVLMQRLLYYTKTVSKRR